MAVKLSIMIIDGPEKGQFLEFEEGPVALGRSKGDIRLSDKKVSSKHCQFLFEDNKVILEDLKSTNGTFIGSKKVNGKVDLHNLDVVTVGLTRLNIGILEELEDFKKANSTETANPKLSFSSDATQRSPNIPEESNSSPIPPEDAEYRQTGINRIDDLIKDEMSAFSKWDHPAISEKRSDGGKRTPKIQLVLVARKAPEGLTQINCSGPKTTVGRKGVDIRINDLDLSRKHAAIEIVGGTKAFIRDLASTNGTFVNGNKISYQELNEGDLIQIGQSVFEVQIQQVET